jgi:hypothetical protein
MSAKTREQTAQRANRTSANGANGAKKTTACATTVNNTANSQA